MNKYGSLVVAAASLVILPFVLELIGLTASSAMEVVIFGLACLGLNILVGNTGLVSFGHGAWFGTGAYAAALTALALPGEHIVLPLIVGTIVCAGFALLFGGLMLKRRGVYFSLMTLALSAMGFQLAFRWTEVTGGENGLGGIERPAWAAFDLNDNWNYYIFVALIASGSS